MSTTLEKMVKYLAGQGDGPPERLHRELNDSSSEASLFLEALRERSRSMFDPGVSPGLDTRTVPLRRGASKPVRVSLAAVAIAAILFIAIGVGWWDRAQLRRLETLQAERDELWKSRIGRLELALAPKAKVPAPAVTPLPPTRPPLPVPTPIPPDRTSEMLLARLEDGLARLDERLKESETPKTETETEPATDDQVRRDLDALKRDMNDREKSLRQDLWEMRSALQGVMFMLRQMSAQSSVGTSMPMPFPTPFPGTMLGPVTGHPSVNGLAPSFPNATQHHPEGAHPAQHPAQHPNHQGHR